MDKKEEVALDEIISMIQTARRSLVDRIEDESLSKNRETSITITKLDEACTWLALSFSIGE